MRIRYLKETEAILHASAYIAALDEQPLKARPNPLIKHPLAGTWKKNHSFLGVEIGCGKGQFLQSMAQKYPDLCLVGVEKVSTILARAALRLESGPSLPNIRLLRADAALLPTYFNEGEVDRIYLNFSDPWPRAKHEKRRLSAPAYLAVYKKLLCKGGLLVLKTDNEALYRFSLENLQHAGWKEMDLSEDLHSSLSARASYPYVAPSLTTEYEDSFLRQNKPIFYLAAAPPGD